MLPPTLRATSRLRQQLAPQQHVNSKLRFVPILFLLCLHIYWPFRFDFAREFVFRATLTWWGYRFDPCRAPSLDSADPFELLKIHGRAWAPRHSQRACLRSSVDFRTCRDRPPHRAKCPMHRRRSALQRGSSSGRARLQAFVQASHAGGRGFEPVFRAFIWLRNGRQRERPQAAFLSLRMTMKSSEGEGETCESPTDSPPDTVQHGPSCWFAGAILAKKAAETLPS
jgi:hypothetical protein